MCLSSSRGPFPQVSVCPTSSCLFFGSKLDPLLQGAPRTPNPNQPGHTPACGFSTLSLSSKVRATPDISPLPPRRCPTVQEVWLTTQDHKTRSVEQSRQHTQAHGLAHLAWSLEAGGPPHSPEAGHRARARSLGPPGTPAWRKGRGTQPSVSRQQASASSPASSLSPRIQPWTRDSVAALGCCLIRRVRVCPAGAGGRGLHICPHFGQQRPLAQKPASCCSALRPSGQAPSLPSAQPLSPEPQTPCPPPLP